MYYLNNCAQAPVPANTDGNLTRYHIEPVKQQEVNNIGKISTTSEEFGSSANKLPVGQKYHLIKSPFVPSIKLQVSNAISSSVPKRVSVTILL